MTTQAPLKILFAGTADFSASFLTSILTSQHQVIGVVTQEDKIVGRGKKVQMTKVKEIALQHEIPVYQFQSSLRNKENYEQLTALDYDIMVVVAFGDILPIELLDHPKYKSINVHPSLLPYGRGASPVQNTIAKGDEATAFCVIKMDATLDTGDILLWEDVAIDPKETSESLFAKLSTLGGPLLNKVLDNIEEYLANATQQRPLPEADAKKAYTKKIKKTSGQIKTKFSATTLERKFRAYQPWPGLFFSHPFENNQEIKVTDCNAITDIAAWLAQSNNVQLLPEFAAFLAQDFSLDDKAVQAYAPFVGRIVATEKKAIYVACNKYTLLQITQIQLPGKKPTDIISIRNGYPHLVALDTRIISE